VATLELEEGEGDGFEPVVVDGIELVEEEEGVLELLGMALVLVEDGWVVVVVGTEPLPYSQLPDKTPWSSVPPKE
jgi:hypothetical protein